MIYELNSPNTLGGPSHCLFYLSLCPPQLIHSLSLRGDDASFGTLFLV